MSEVLEPRAGDWIEIRLRGRILSAVVTSAENYGTRERPNWYIETKDPYIYWKQALDGGEIVSVTTPGVPPELLSIRSQWARDPISKHHPDCACDRCMYGDDRTLFLFHPSEY